MYALIGLIIGGVAGWFTGYAFVMIRVRNLSDGNVLAQSIGSMMAPTAPDTILFCRNRGSYRLCDRIT